MNKHIDHSDWWTEQAVGFADHPDNYDEDEQEYWESADRDPEAEDMTDDDWTFWLEVVGT